LDAAPPNFIWRSRAGATSRHSHQNVARWTDTLSARARTGFDLLTRYLSQLPEPTALLARRLLDNRGVILAHIEEGRNATFDGTKIRHHGDFHLGQVLIAKDDAYILDFEGEPRRTLDERRRKAPAARDVAGFLRSVDYAVSAAIDREPTLNADERAAIARQMRTWGDSLATAYLECYRATIADASLWPADEDQTRRLLELFLLEKALYEIEYDLTNRPSWCHIPLEATLRILEQRGVIRP